MVLFKYLIQFLLTKFVKKHFFQTFLIALLLMTGFVYPFSDAQAQSQVPLEFVKITLLPEHNQPLVLVIYEIQLDQSVNLPKDLAFQIPGDAQLLIIGYQEEDGSFILLEHTLTDNSYWNDIRFTANTHTIHIEYFDPNLIEEGDRRMFEYQWLSIYAVNDLSIIVQPPPDASSVISEPPLDNLTWQAEETVPPGNLVSFSLMYTKSTDDLSGSIFKVEPRQPSDETVLGRSLSPFSVVLWLMSVALTILFMVGLYFIWFKASVKNKPARVVRGVEILNPEKQVIFCHECGMRARLGDSYCSNCATELRKPSEFNPPPDF